MNAIRAAITETVPASKAPPPPRHPVAVKGAQLPERGGCGRGVVHDLEGVVVERLDGPPGPAAVGPATAQSEEALPGQQVGGRDAGDVRCGVLAPRRAGLGDQGVDPVVETLFPGVIGLGLYRL